MTGIVGLIMAALKDFATGVRKVAPLDMVNDEGMDFLGTRRLGCKND
jgi:hypothetical protein